MTAANGIKWRIAWITVRTCAITKKIEWTNVKTSVTVWKTDETDNKKAVLRAKTTGVRKNKCRGKVIRKIWVNIAVAKALAMAVVQVVREALEQEVNTIRVQEASKVAAVIDRPAKDPVVAEAVDSGEVINKYDIRLILI